MGSFKADESPRLSRHCFGLRLSLSVCQLLAATHGASAQFSASPPIEVGSRKQLFLDDHLIASTTNIVRRIHAAQKSGRNPVIRQTEAWEDPFNIVYGSVIRDGQKYMVWYKSGPGVSYAESDDGIRWIKPALDL